MKKYLLTLGLVALFGLYTKLNAQCSLSNIVVTLNSANNVGGNCQLDMDISFDMQDNAGNKYIYINLWKSSDYSFVNFNYGASGAKGPKLNEIDGPDHTHPPVAVIGINNNTTPVAYLTSYSPDPTNITLKSGTSITNTPNGSAAHFVLSHVTFTTSGSCAGLVLQGDIWSTQSQSANPAIHCYGQGISFFGDPTINGTINCNVPHQFQVLLSTVSTTPITTSYKVYLDYPPVGTLTSADTLIYTSSSFSISSSSSYNSGLIPYLPYSGRKASADQPLLVEVSSSTSSFSKTSYGDIFNSCAPLPVNFGLFTAQRNSASSVKLVWQTSTEVNNSGFAVERNINGTWEQIAFVPSQANGGNSADLLTYSYYDQNSNKGISQYRIRQIDINGKSATTDIRAVRGVDQAGKTIVYPNPSFDGKVNVVFEDASAIRDVSLIDMSGRIIKQWNGVSNNNLQIDNLVPGFYSLRVVVRETGAQSVEKIVINKR